MKIKIQFYLYFFITGPQCKNETSCKNIIIIIFLAISQVLCWCWLPVWWDAAEYQYSIWSDSHLTSTNQFVLGGYDTSWEDWLSEFQDCLPVTTITSEYIKQRLILLRFFLQTVVSSTLLHTHYKGRMGTNFTLVRDKGRISRGVWARYRA